MTIGVNSNKYTLKSKSNGCRKHDDCLSCPLPCCIYDKEYAQFTRKEKREKIRLMAKKLTMHEIADQLGVSPQAIYSALKEQ